MQKCIEFHGEYFEKQVSFRRTPFHIVKNAGVSQGGLECCLLFLVTFLSLEYYRTSAEVYLQSNHLFLIDYAPDCVPLMFWKTQINPQ